MMKRIILCLLLGAVMFLRGEGQIIDKPYSIDTVGTFPDIRTDEYSQIVADVIAVFSMDSEMHSFMDLIYGRDTIHFKSISSMEDPPSSDSSLYIHRYAIMNLSDAKLYRLNLMFYTEDDSLAAIGIGEGFSLSIFNIKGEIKQIEQ